MEVLESLQNHCILGDWSFSQSRFPAKSKSVTAAKNDYLNKTQTFSYIQATFMFKFHLKDFGMFIPSELSTIHISLSKFQ